jgi:hypothetical protein
VPRAKPFQSKRLGGRSCTQITMSVCLLLLIGIGEPTKVAITAIEATITVQQTSSQKQEIVEVVEELLCVSSLPGKYQGTQLEGLSAGDTI